MAGNSESNKRAVQTRKERHGSDFYKRITSLGGKQRTRGYFGYLKDTNPQALRELSKDAAAKSAKARSKSKVKRANTTKTDQTPIPRGRP